jgi:hypothetical protein
LDCFWRNGFTVSSSVTISVNGTITIAAGGTFSLTGNATVAGAVSNSGTIVVNDNPSITVTGTVTHNNPSTLEYAGSATRDLEAGTNPEHPNSGGNLTVGTGRTVVYNNENLSRKSDMVIDGTVELKKNTNFGSGKGVTIASGGRVKMSTFKAICNSENAFLIINNGGILETANPNGLRSSSNGSTKTLAGFSSITLSTGSEVIYNATGAQNIDADVDLGGGQKYSKLTIAGSGTKTLTGTTTVTNTLDLQNSTTLATTGFLVITSGARVDQLDGTISGDMQVETALTSNRKYRFLCSPVVGGTGLQWRDNAAAAPGTSGRGILITGSPTNFDASTTNNPSAFNWTEANGNGSTTISSSATDNAGWGAWTDGNQALTNGIGYRVYVRGDRSISLNGGSTTPNSTTIWVKGSNPSSSTINVSVSQTTQNSTSKGWNLIGNPYPSNWASQVSAGADNSFYVYGVGSNSYQTLSFGSGIVMPAQAFFIHLQNAGTTNFSFSESQKTASSASGNYFKKGAKNELSFRFQYDSLNYSDVKVGFKENATDVFDPSFDAYGLTNPVVNLASYDAQGLMYNWNYLPDFASERVVPLTLKNSTAATYSITFSGLNTFENGMEVSLKDNFLNTITPISNNLVYPITITDNVNSGGNNRLELLFKKNTTGLNNPLLISNNFTLYPNPATESINLSLITSQNGVYNYRIYNQLGEEVMVGNFDFGKQRNLAINIEGLSNGVYFVKLNSSTSTETIKFIK